MSAPSPWTSAMNRFSKSSPICDLRVRWDENQKPQTPNSAEGWHGSRFPKPTTSPRKGVDGSEQAGGITIRLCGGGCSGGEQQRWGRRTATMRCRGASWLGNPAYLVCGPAGSGAAGFGSSGAVSRARWLGIRSTATPSTDCRHCVHALPWIEPSLAAAIVYSNVAPVLREP